MRSQLLHEAEGLRTFAVVFDDGDDPITGLRDLAEADGVTAASFTAIGAFRHAELGWFDPERNAYRRHQVTEQCEVLTLAGDVAVHQDAPSVHAHVVLGRADFSTTGGHLFAASVRPTLELVLTETPAHLRKRRDPATGLALIHAGAG